MGEKTVRCKFEIHSIVKHESGEVELQSTAVCDGSPENETFWAATPGGSLSFYCVKDGVLDHLKPGDEIYLDITKAPAPAAA